MNEKKGVEKKVLQEKETRACAHLEVIYVCVFICFDIKIYKI